MSRSEQRAKLVELARVIWDRLRAAEPKLPPNAAAALNRPVYAGQLRWVLAVLIAAALGSNRMSSDESIDLIVSLGLQPSLIRVLMAEMGAGYVVAQLDGRLAALRGLPQALLDQDHEAATRILASAVGGGLAEWAESYEVIGVADAISKRWPDPSSGQRPIWGERPDEPGARFDSADYKTRRRNRER